MSAKIGFVGVGRMGANMARHLKLDCNYNVSAIYDIDREMAASLAEELGSQSFDSLAAVTAHSDIVLTVVTDDAAMRSIFLEKEKDLLVAAAGKTFINCATLSPAIHREVANAAQAAGAKTLEACMASSISHARGGQLYLMVSGDTDAYQNCQTLLEDLSVKLRFIEGGAGRAAEVKALVNMVMNINTASLAEGLGLASALGHDLEMICEVFSQTGANSRVLVTDSEDMIARDHDCWFSASHAAKDSGIAQGLAIEMNLKLPVNDATKAQYDLMTTEGLGELDKSGIAELTFRDRHSK